MGTVNDHSNLECLLVSLFWLNRSRGVSDNWHCRRGSTHSHYPRTLKHSVQLRYLHKFLDSWIQVCDFEVATLLSCCRPCTQQGAQTSAIDMRNVAQIEDDSVG